MRNLGGSTELRDQKIPTLRAALIPTDNQAQLCVVFSKAPPKQDARSGRLEWGKPAIYARFPSDARLRIWRAIQTDVTKTIV